MPKKKTESDQQADGQAIDAAAATKRRRRTADDILSKVPDQPEPEKAKPKKPAVRQKTLAEEVVEDKDKPKPKRTVKPKAEAPVAAPEATAESIPATEKPKRATRRTKKPAGGDDLIDPNGVFTLTWREKSTAPRPTRVAEDSDFEDPEDRIAILSWREPGLVPRPAEVEQEAAAEEASPTRRSRKRRGDAEPTAADAFAEKPLEVNFRRRGAERAATTETDLEPEPLPVQEPEPEPVAAEPVRLPIERKEGAAQVALHRGHPTIIRQQRAFAPIMFYADAQSSEQRGIVLEELKEAADQGLEIFSFRLALTVGVANAPAAVDFAVQLARDATSVAPGIQLVPRISFATPDNWQSEFPDAFYRYLNGDIADPSVSDDAYWDEAERTLESVIAGIRESDQAAQFMGVHFDQHEWFLDEEDGYDISQASRAKFRRWLRMRYRNDIVSLRAAWFDGGAEFDSIAIPDYREGLGGEEFVRTDRRARRWVDYHLFVSDEIVERITKMCYAAKKASDGDFLVGVSYGYTFEWSHPFSGHLSLGKLLRCDELDYAAGPSSYRDREPGGTAAFPFPVDSFAINGKLYMAEEDFRTPISGREDRNLMRNPLMKTPQALESAHWRGVGGALAHEGGVIWMDSNGSGWLNSPGIWERGKEVRELLARRLASGKPSPDVAFFIDERSLAYLTDPRAFEILIQQVREALLRSGLSVGFFLLSDLAHRKNFPECKLHIFVNAWDMRPEVRSAIKQRLQRNGKTLFWLYTAGLFEAGRDSLERVREVTGIALRPQPFNCKSGTTLLNTREELSSQLDQSELAQGGQLEPSYFAIPEDSMVLGEYTETGLPSFVVARVTEGAPSERWTSVFLGEPMVSPGLFRALAHQNGAHVWAFDNDLVHANPPFVTIHCQGTGPRSLMLPDNWAAYHVDMQEYIPVENACIKFKAVDGSTHTFLVGTLGDIQAILNSDPAELLQVTEPVVREENTLHLDRIAFDVAIMKLDEWVEETWSEDHADDLLLRPSMVDSVDESAEEAGGDEESAEDDRTSGRRRKRRRRSPERQKGGESFGQTGVSVLFRKRN
ncbi:MAG: beta-galactosidase [Armatimonadetes bacterium]|nr:beta-galactosidase [Armatimonadota bacterium]MBX3109466.1 beta-galactosidase [Fimbriimonadaceae bacterium]